MTRNRKIVLAVLGFALAAVADYGSTQALLAVGVNQVNGELAGSLVFALVGMTALWFILRPRRKPVKRASS